MLKKQFQPTSNNSKCVLMIMDGANKRRSMAMSVIKSVNCEFGIKPQLAVVK